jgi:hypothetical protein
VTPGGAGTPPAAASARGRTTSITDNAIRAGKFLPTVIRLIGNRVLTNPSLTHRNRIKPRGWKISGANSNNPAAMMKETQSRTTEGLPLCVLDFPVQKVQLTDSEDRYKNVSQEHLVVYRSAIIVNL